MAFGWDDAAKIAGPALGIKNMAFGWDDAAKIAGPALGIVAGIGAGKRQIKQQKKFNIS